MTCFCADEGGAAADTLKAVRRIYMRPECRSAAFRAVKGRILHAADRRGRERPQERDGRRQCRRKPRLRLFGGRTALTEAAFGESPAVRHAPFRADSARLPERRQTGGDSTETGGAFRRLLLHTGKSFVHGRQRQSKAGSKRKKRNCGGRGRRGAGLRQGFFARKNGASIVRMKSFPFAARPASCNLVPGHDSIPCFFFAVCAFRHGCGTVPDGRGKKMRAAWSEKPLPGKGARYSRVPSAEGASSAWFSSGHVVPG